MSRSIDWLSVWNEKATESTEFQATGRSRMDVVGFLYTIREIKENLDLNSADTLLDIGCGSGIVALALAPWVARLHGIDPSPRMIERATRNCEGIPNISFSVDAVPNLKVRGLFDKVLAYSTLQYLPDEESAKLAFSAIRAVLADSGKVFLGANPDPTHKGLYRATVENADMTEEERSINLAYIDATLWLLPFQAVELAEACGLRADVRPMHHRIWQHFYMYNLVLWPR